MAEDESFELIALCEQILEDSEVTADEVAKLGTWLAAHEEMRRTWPGTVLAKPIEDVLLDGKVNKTELRKVATLLRRVQKEWVARRDEKVKQAAAEKAAAAAQAMDLSQPLLPSIAITLHVKSHSDDSLVYTVDLAGPACSCQDWVGTRNSLPRGNLTRCCKHVLDAYSRVRPMNGWPSWLDAFLENGWKPHPDKQWFVVSIGADFALISSGGNEWADAFTPVGRKHQRFGFNILDRRWAYGREPEGARQIERVLLKQSDVSNGGFLRKLFAW